MPWFRITLLIVAMTMTSGYRFRCYIGCVDQTGTQNDYVEQRDYCREYAQLKASMAMREAGGGDDKSRKGTLVSLFSQCMGNNGWTVPDGKGGDGTKKAEAPPTSIISQAATGAPLGAAAVAVNKADEKASTTRAAECSFARSSASVSSIAKKRAEACDLQCAEELRIAPNAPRPASCPADLPSKYSKGYEE